MARLIDLRNPTKEMLEKLPPFAIAPADAQLKRADIPLLKVRLDPLSEVIMDKAGRKEIERSMDSDYVRKALERFDQGEPEVSLTNDNSKFRFSAGGLLQVLRFKDGKFALFLRRDEGAPSYPGHIALCSGLSGPAEGYDDPVMAYRRAYNEIINPINVMLREGNEEVLVVAGDQLLMPTLSDPVYYKDAMGLLKLEKIANVASMMLDVDQQWILEVYLSKQLTSRNKAIVNIDPNAAAIDLLGLMEVNLANYNVKDVSIYDGEIIGGRLLGREVYLVPVEELTYLSEGKGVSAYVCKEGDWEEKTQVSLPMTPPTKEVVDAVHDKL